MIEEIKNKRGRPRKSPEEKEQSREARHIQKEVVETIREITKYVPEPRLEGFELYKALKDKGYFQGGMGQTIEDPQGTETVYIPHYTELLTYFNGDPDKMERMRDAIIRAYIELQ